MSKVIMRAVLPEVEHSNARNLSHEKETVATYKVIGKFPKGKLQVLCEARMYMGRSNTASTVYCSLWVHGKKSTSGRGQAGGYGYHKESAALQSAINSAGISLFGATFSNTDQKINLKRSANIGGVGDDAMRTALISIARAAGARGELLVC